MISLRRVGAAGAFLQTAYFVLVLLFLLVLLPGNGFDPTAENYHNAGVALDFAAHSPLRGHDDLKDVVLAVGAVLGAVAAFELWADKDRWLMRLALVFGIAACALLLGSGIMGFTSVPILADLFASGVTADASGAYLAVTLVSGGLRLAGLFAYGAWALLASWNAIRAKLTPGPLAILGIVMGAALMLSAVVGGIISLIGLLCALVWTVWLGVWLLTRKPAIIDSVVV